eukprot:NODE_167_length_14562_cov_0.357256.p14 type:complete len:108 gc:universal NODE_167_length_14562_cov_0.357256:8412-8089(-)
MKSKGILRSKSNEKHRSSMVTSGSSKYVMAYTVTSGSSKYVMAYTVFANEMISQRVALNENGSLFFETNLWLICFGAYSRVPWYSSTVSTSVNCPKLINLYTISSPY